MKQRILILCNKDSGIYDFRKELLVRLLEDGYEVVVSVPEGQYVEKIKALGCEIEIVDINRRGTNPVQDIGLFLEYRRICKKVRPDVIVTYTIKPNIYGGICAQWQRIPYMATITGLGAGFDYQGPMKKLIVALYRNALKKASCIFFQNTENQGIFQSYGIVGRKERLVAGSGVNLDNYHVKPYPKNEKPYLFLAGRIMREKGIEEYLNSVKKYANRVKFGIIGYYEEGYEEEIETLRKQGLLEVVGFQKDMHPYYEACDGVVVASYHEGISNVLLEAGATGRPALATDIPGCREVVEDNVTGILFQVQSARALEEAIESFLSMSVQERAGMGMRARAKVEREFDRRQIVEAYVEEIKRVLK